nr:unnamed protein product [Callosobruchus chinensis]
MIITRSARRYHSINNFVTEKIWQVLCEQQFDWVPCSGGNIPPDAVEGGRTSDGEVLYIGRAFHEGSHTVGKVNSFHNIPSRAQRYRLTHFN